MVISLGGYYNYARMLVAIHAKWLIVIAHTSVTTWKQITEIQSHLGVLAALPKLS